MIKSMTGFGRAEKSDDRHKLTVEIKSVNNRYLDFNIRMPKKFSLFESRIRSALKEYMLRGKVDVFITAEDYLENSGNLSCNFELAKKYADYCTRLGETTGLANNVTVCDLARFPEVFSLGQSDENEDEIWAELETVLRQAAVQFAASRSLEGGRLKADILEKLNGMSGKVAEIEEREPQIMADYRSKLEEKVRDLLAEKEIDESRIASEVIIYADKICTDEETVRLKSHIQQMMNELEDGDGVGRKMDFLSQEMNREANTILSKAGDLATSNIGIDLKTEIEKIREQIQNIE